MEKAQSQTIEGPDGLPMENMKFCGSAQELMAVVQNNKPVAANDFDTNYKSSPFFGVFVQKGKEEIKEHICKSYTYSDVYTAAKRVNLLRYKYEKGFYYYFLKENIIHAYSLSLLWDSNIQKREIFDLNVTEYDLAVGHLLGYKKKDIRAWYLFQLQDLFHINFNNMEDRKKIKTNASFLKKKQELISDFEANYTSAIQKLKQVQATLTVPESWRKKCHPLPAPPRKTRKQKK